MTPTILKDSEGSDFQKAVLGSLRRKGRWCNGWIHRPFCLSDGTVEACLEWPCTRLSPGITFEAWREIIEDHLNDCQTPVGVCYVYEEATVECRVWWLATIFQEENHA